MIASTIGIAKEFERPISEKWLNVCGKPRRMIRVLLGLSLVACNPGQQAAKPTNIKLYSIGHSLSSEIPDMVASLAKNTPGLKFEFQEQFRLGASLEYQWNEVTRPADKWDDKQFRISYPNSLGKGGYNAVVLVDSVPRGGEWQEKNSIEYLTKFADYIGRTNPNATIYYVEPWHGLNSGTGKAQWDTHSPTKNLPWRKRIDADIPMWQRIKTAAEKATGKKIVLIREAQALGALVDAAEAGRIPGFKTAQDFFGDDIHLKPVGMYFIACLQYGVIFGRSPEGLTVDVKGRWGTEYWGKQLYGNGPVHQRPAPEAVKEMQRIAWQFAK